MSNKKVTKRALLTSILAICLCLVMLIGSTFAWFTDTASTSVNQIESGTLKVGLKMATEWNEDGTVKTWSDAKGQVLNFRKAAGHENEAIRWEPGCTYELPALKVVNEGNLALKYKIQIAGIKGDAMLNNVIDWTINDEAIDLAEQKLSAKQEGVAFTIKGHMQETAGNDYQNQSIDGIAITVLATQDTVEFDSINNTYDELAQYPIAASGTVTVDNDGKVTAPVTIVSAEKTEDGTASIAQATIPADAQAESAETTQMTLSVTNAEKPANFHTLDADQTSNTLEVKMIGLSADNTEPIKVALFVGENLNGFKLYHHEKEMTAKDSVDAVINDQDYYYNSETGIVTFLTAKFSPFTLVYDKGNWSDNTEGDYETPVDETSKTVTIASAEELALFAKEVNGGKSYAGYTVKLVNDINLAANKWTPVNAWKGKLNNVTIDGMNHTISNMTTEVGDTAGFIDTSASSITVKDVTFDNAYVKTTPNKSQSYAGVVVGKTYSTTKLINVKVVNSQVVNNWQCGGMVGFAENAQVSFENCVVEDSHFGGYSATAGSFFGLGIVDIQLNGCIARNIQLYTDSLTWSSTAKANGNFYVGHLYGKTLTANNCQEENVTVVNK